MRARILSATSLTFAISFIALNVQASVLTLSGAVVVSFSYNPNGGGVWYFDSSNANSITNGLTLTAPPVIDIAIEPSVIGPGMLSWSDANNWTQPSLDTSGVTVSYTGSGTYNSVINDARSTINALIGGSYGPSEGAITNAHVTITNIQGSGEVSPHPGPYAPASNDVLPKFNVTIPTGANVAPPPAFASVAVENLVIANGASLGMTGGFTVRKNFVNHGSGSLAGTVEGDFINDALVADGNTATVTGLTVEGQLQNTGELQVPGTQLKLKAASSNVGAISLNAGTLQVDVSLNNTGTISLSGDASGSAGLSGAGTVTNHGTFQWSQAALSIPTLVNNSHAFSITGSALKRCDATLTNNGTITQSSSNSPGIAQLINQASAIYDITGNSGLTGTFVGGAATNAGLFRKSGGTGTSTIDVPFTNSGTIAVHSGVLAFHDTLTLTASSTLEFQLSGLTPATHFGRVDILNLGLAGTLHVTLADGFSPAIGNAFDLFDVGSFLGFFSALQLPPLAAGRQWNTSQLYTTGVISVSAAPAAPGDFDGDDDVDGADFVAWQIHFPKPSGATLAQGDADGDGDVDAADFVVWQTHFSAGGGATPVPEPAAWFLVAVATLFMLLQQVGHAPRV